ncbi:LytTR family two component transcriptional regulator [Dinghuibacter silviterrae]|uniref:LytTR family two component transcriptional regulator n=2 Tax=Dinghuibacter silviterrae TaxID=1539049 RepID=A0A4R8DIW6_9BACT|nr:LytTR family two component transcriptional regulator [Dinghuibacter silviterrae]
MRCIAIDDEPLALALVKDYISKVPFLELVATCGDPFEAAAVLQANEVDLLFIDIQMPGLTGLQFIQSLTKRPMVILITAYRKFALEGFDLDVVDYLVKPVGLDRFMKACNKAQELFQLRATAGQAAPGAAATRAAGPPAPGATAAPGQAHPDFFFLNVDYSLVKVLFSDIIWIEGSGDYVKVHLHSSPRPLLVRMSTRAMEAELPTDRFVRIHKSYIIAVASITAVRKNSVFIKDMELPVGETYREAIQRLTGRSL